MEPQISIIIIVKDDRGIADTLAGLAAQEKPASAEVIVVDASDPSTLADIRARYPDVRWHQFTPAAGRKTSIPEQRNFGIRSAKGDIIVFIDANCVPSKDWLSMLVGPILAGKETMAAGSVRATNPRTYVNLNPQDDENDGYLTTSPTINLAFKRSLWEKVGGFDETFLFGSDVDFTWRCHRAGNRILFVGKAVVTHNWGTFSDEVRRSFKYGRTRAIIFKKNPELIRELFGGNVYILVYTIYLAGLPATYFFWWYPLVILVPFVKNIGHHPFKRVFLNMLYTVGMWLEIFSLLFRAIFSKDRVSSAKNRL